MKTEKSKEPKRLWPLTWVATAWIKSRWIVFFKTGEGSITKYFAKEKNFFGRTTAEKMNALFFKSDQLFRLKK